MMEKRTTALTCLFLHDTQMADLHREQGALRRLWGKFARESESLGIGCPPFNVFPPFCPAPDGFARDGASAKGSLAIDAPIAENGWILRAVPGLSREPEWRAPISLPLFPPLPATRGFILGYAGQDAPRMVELLAEGGPVRPFQVHAWYLARFTLALALGETSYRYDYEIGPARWHRAK